MKGIREKAEMFNVHVLHLDVNCTAAISKKCYTGDAKKYEVMDKNLLSRNWI